MGVWMKPSRTAPYIAALAVCFLLWHFRPVSRTGIDPRTKWDHDYLAHDPPQNQSTADHGERVSLSDHSRPLEAGDRHLHNEPHPIDRLIEQADSDFRGVFERKSSSLKDAAEAYRKRRGRHPPPGFDHWYEYADRHKAVIVEDFWDQIYDDLGPFWGVPAPQIRAQARKLGMAVVIEDGKAKATTDWFWHTIFAKMMSEVSVFLPNMVIPVNAMDEPRLMVPWAKISELISTAQREQEIATADVKSRTTGWGLEAEADDTNIPDMTWRTSPPYSYARMACSPESPLRRGGPAKSPPMLMDSINRQGDQHSPPDPDTLLYLQARFVSNYSEASDLCMDAAIGYYHAALTDPLTASTSTDLLPMFGGSKLAAVNNEILMPAPMYWNEEERFMEPDPFTWAEKTDTVIWRGTATGGWNKPNTWTRFHRHRFVAVTNGTKYSETQGSRYDDIFTPLWHLTAISKLKNTVQTHLASWLSKLMDVAFTDLFCDTHNDEAEPGAPYGECWYTSPHYQVLPGMKMSLQFHNKFLPDIDGNSFSGRYRSFLLSNSLPIKATLYREWHDSRLMAWKHFVPMNNRFDDFYRLMEYFVGCSKEVCGGDGVAGHDAAAERIATAGREWAEKVLRKEDMQIYVARLLLEWARVTDDDRLRLGWTGDLG